VLMVVHVLAYLARTLRVGPADWRAPAALVVAGARSRRAALGGALLAGVILASATYPAWRHQHRERGDDEGLAHVSAVVMPNDPSR
jgi:hypothetical protein